MKKEVNRRHGRRYGVYGELSSSVRVRVLIDVDRRREHCPLPPPSPTFRSHPVLSTMSENNKITFRGQGFSVPVHLNHTESNLKLSNLLMSTEIPMVFVTVTLLAIG